MRFKRSKCERIDFNLQDEMLLGLKKDYISVKYMNEILIASEGIQQVNLFKKIASHIQQNDLEEDELNFAVNALSIAFYQAPSKSSLKKALNRIIEEISLKHPLLVENYLQKSLEGLISLSDLYITPDEIEAQALHIMYLIDNLKLGKEIVNLNFQDVWKHICLILDTVIEKIKKEKNVQKIDDYYDVCQNILKLITQFIQGCDQLKESLRSQSGAEFNTTSENIKNSLLYLLSHEETKLNCRLNAAFVFCHFYYFMFGDEKLKDDLLYNNTANFSLSSQLCIFSGVMAVLPVEKFVESMNGYMIAAKIPCDITKISESSNSSEILVLCARNILQCTNVIQNVFTKELPVDENKIENIAYLFSEDKEFMEMLFEYVLHSREHFIDSIRHLSKDIFKNILNIHLLSSKIEASESALLKEMTIYLLKELPSHSRSKYGMLSCIVEKIGTNTILQWHSMLPVELFEALEDCSLVSHVSELSQVLFSCTPDTGDDPKFQNTWLVPLLKVLCDGSKGQINAISDHILPKLLGVKPASLVFLLTKLSNKWENDTVPGNSFSALITCLKLYQKQKDFHSYSLFLSDFSMMKAFVHADDQVRISAFSLLCESSKTTEPVASSTFELIKYALHYNINCQSPAFRQQLISLMKKLFTRIRDSSYSIMKKQLCDDSNKDIKPEVMFPSKYEKFLYSLKNELFGYLQPGANFPRRVTSLNLLYTLNEIFQDCAPIVDSETDLQTLLYVLQDTYDNNKLLALKMFSSKSLELEKADEKLFQSALILASSTKPPDTATAAYLFTYMVQYSSYQQIIERHLTSVSSQETKLNLKLPNILDSTDLHLNTIALLMYELQNQLDNAKINILQAAVSAPLYGILTCIRSVLKDVKFNQESIAVWRHLIKELIMLSFDVAKVVEPIVCNSSPEGYLPSETDDDSIAQLQAAVRRALGCRFQTAVVEENPSCESDAVVVDIVKSHAVTAQLLLLCCWRSHKEVSLLFGDISEKVPLINIESDEFQGMLHPSEMKKMGQYFLSQMSLVKHKGAFEQAQIGFSKVCNKLWRCDVSDLCELPKAWLNDMILSIKGLKEDIQLCPTRRSAGLPFIIQAILTSEPNFLNSTFFKNSMSHFLTLAESNESYSTDVQIHALNVLRTLFRDACLGEAVMPFVSKGLQLSIEGFKSNIWAVRNSSTLLFTALMTRIFGVNRSQDEAGKKNRLSGKCFYSYYKDLYLFLIDELNQCVSSSHLKELNPNKGTKVSIRPSLYPILLVLGRLYPAPGEKDTILSVFVPNLKICLCSPIWKTRSLAAKALVSLSPLEKVFSNVKLLLENFDQILAYNQNEIHGHLLLLRYFIEEIGFMSESEKNDLKCLFQVNFSKYFDLFIRLNVCASIRVAFLEVYLYAMVLDLDSSDVLITKSLIQAVIRDCSKSDFYLDTDNYLALASSIMFLEICRLSEDDSEHIVGAWTHLPLKKIVESVLCGNHKSVTSTLTEVFLWLLQEDYKLPDYSLSSCDDVVAQKVLKAVILLDKSKFDVTKIKEDPDICRSLLESFHKEDDQLLLKQYCKLLRYMPPVLTSCWEFVPNTYSCDLLNKLKYVLNRIDNFRDDVICELLLLSTDMIVKLAFDYESGEETKNAVIKENFDVIEKWLQKIEECAYPDNSIIFRQTVVTILDKLTAKLFFPTSKLLGFRSTCLWQSLMLLLVDDEPDIKHGVCEVIVKMKLAHDDGNKILSTISSKAIDLMLEIFVQTSKDTNSCISMLVNWMLSSNTSCLDSVNDEQPFDKGEMNVYSEDLQLTDTVSRHLGPYLATLETPGKCLISSQTVCCWNQGHGKELTFAEAIVSCLSEANSILDKFLSRGAVSPILDSLFNEELIQIRQRLVVTSDLLPFSQLLPDFKVLSNELLRKFESLDFRTFFIETCIADILSFLKLL